MSDSTCYVDIFHEIKNSVTLINSYLQLIEKKHPEIALFDYWESSRMETSRLRMITSELSQLKFGQDLNPETIDLKDFLTSCCNSFHCSPADEDVSCRLSLPVQPLRIFADIKQLRHAIINLLKNSCEAMNHCGQILVDARKEGSDISIRITDSGCGIAADLLPTVFDPFITTKEDGSGLGLHIAKEIITAHNGTIAVESKEGCGCTFTISLPVSSDTGPPPEESRQ